MSDPIDPVKFWNGDPLEHLPEKDHARFLWDSHPARERITSAADGYRGIWLTSRIEDRKSAFCTRQSLRSNAI